MPAAQCSLAARERQKKNPAEPHEIYRRCLGDVAPSMNGTRSPKALHWIEWGLYCRYELDEMGVAVQRMNGLIMHSCQPIRVRGHEAR